ncbi:restriction endonuclease [Vibrio makurazakiensis]|uniref:restriction endonuclease n=1 Tax=Vibrio makurazakiensis TaxID=2910250 RepID=UPI003D0D0A8C
MDIDNIPDWKALENLVVMIQKQLAPDAIVKHNVMLEGVESETKRQIDVLVEQSIGQYTMRIVIDCKDYAKPVDVKGVEEFHGLVQDVKAQKGALVCPSGFTKSALKRAKKLQIDLYRPVSTGNHKWKASITAPVICDFRNSYMSFGISSSDPKPLMIPQEFYKLSVANEEGTILGSAIETAQRKWDEGLLPSEPGQHEPLSIFGEEKVFIDNGYGDKVNVKLTVQLLVQQNLYLGHLPIEELNGLHDEHTGEIVTNAFTVGGLNPEEVQKSWKAVDDNNTLDFQPLFKIVGYDCYGIGT